ncbi:MAG: hypothetical protein AB7G21_09740 [Dehalococcoidia bacterium]
MSADVLAQLRRLANDPGATPGEREAARLAYGRKAERLGVAPRTMRLPGAKPAALAEHGTYMRATTCTNGCPECGPLRTRIREQQRARNAARKSGAA